MDMLKKTLPLLVFATTSLLADSIFQAVNIGNLGTNFLGAGAASGVALSATGQVIGQSLVNGNPNKINAFYYAGGILSNIGVLGFGADGASRTLAHSMNSSGLVVGQSTAYGQGSNLGERAVLWDGISLNSLGTFGTTSFGTGYSAALSINQAGTAVGTATMYSNGNFVGQRAFQWTSGTGLVDLGVLQNDPNLVNASAALDINNSGRAVGYSTVFTGNVAKGTRAVIFENGSNTQISALGVDGAGFANASATMVNQAGVVAGNSSFGSRGTRGFVYKNGVLTNIGTLGEDQTGYGSSVSKDLSETGIVVGNSQYYANDQIQGERGFLWSNGIMINLGLLAGAVNPGSYSEANGVNDGGQVVGRSSSATNVHATWWSNGMLYDLNDLVSGLNGYVLEDAVDINNLGQILVNGMNYSTNETRAFLLTPVSGVPEPQTYLLTGLGLIAIARIGKRIKDC